MEYARARARVARGHMTRWYQCGSCSMNPSGCTAAAQDAHASVCAAVSRTLKYFLPWFWIFVIEMVLKV